MAAVARPSTTNSPHLAGSKSMTSSPRSNRNSLHNLDSSLRKDDGTDTKKDTTLPTIKHPDDADATSKNGNDAAPTANAPLAPPPKPNNQNGDNDYFGSTGHLLSKEPNPFENAFGNPADTPGKTQLPGVTSLTSPASLLPGNTPGWPGSLRSGPLSPAMLTGPTGSNDYFNSDHHFAGSFPTPNESSLRTGLTPGGGGSMFPQPSPNSQALYNQLQSGGATPGTLDFHRTAMTARAQSHANSYGVPQSTAAAAAANTTAAAAAAATQSQQNPNIQPDLDSKPFHPTSNGQQDNHDPFGSHQTNDAANGLFMLAQAGGQQRNSQSYPISQSQAPSGYQPKAGAKGSIGSSMSGSTDRGDGQFSDDGDSKPQTRNARAKKGNTTTPTTATTTTSNNNNNNAAKGVTNGKRKTEEPQAKGQPVKKPRGSVGNAMSDELDDDEDDDDDDLDKKDDMNGDKKMTDEEKRKNFLERNRVAALKCRQRKKQWLANLQQKVEMFSTENDALAATVTQLREEIVGLKTLLLAHKDCPVSQAQGISGLQMQQIAGDTPHFANPYGMAMGQQAVMQQGQMQRR